MPAVLYVSRSKEQGLPCLVVSRQRSGIGYEQGCPVDYKGRIALPFDMLADAGIRAQDRLRAVNFDGLIKIFSLDNWDKIRVSAVKAVAHRPETISTLSLILYNGQLNIVRLLRDGDFTIRLVNMP
jgi:hypothetical protein